MPIVEKQLAQQNYIAANHITIADMALLAALDPIELVNVEIADYGWVNNWRKKLMSERFYTACHENYAATFNKVTSNLKP